MKFKNYNDLDNHVRNILLRREKDIENVEYSWLIQSYRSEMFLDNEKGQKIINVEKAEEHLKLVVLYRLILNNDYPFKEKEPIIKPEPKSINPRYNAKVLREYEKQLIDESKRRSQYNSYIETANSIIKSLNLKLTISEIKNDFNESRSIVKRLFQNIFSKYGILLDDIVINNVFGKVRLSKEKGYVDNILLFTKNTSFNFPLRTQFCLYNNGAACGIFSAFFMRASGYFGRHSNEIASNQIKENLSTQDNNPFFREKAVIRILASAVTCAYG